MSAAMLGRDGAMFATRWVVALPLAAGGLLIAVGGNLHPRGARATVRETIAHMLDSSRWNLAHLLILAGLLMSTGAFVMARRTHAFGAALDRRLAITAACWGVASIELIPHLMATRDRDALHLHHDTPMLDTHLTLAVVATPLIGLSAVALAVGVARAARTIPAWILAGVATVGGITYAAAGPLIRFVDNPELSVLFAGQSLIAVWLVGTAVRLAAQPADDALTLPDGVLPAR